MASIAPSELFVYCSQLFFGLSLAQPALHRIVCAARCGSIRIQLNTTRICEGARRVKHFSK